MPVTVSQLKKLSKKRDDLKKEVEALRREYKSMFKALAHKEEELKKLRKEGQIASSEAFKATTLMKKDASAFAKKNQALNKREKAIKKRERLLTSIDRSIEKQKNKLADLLSKRAEIEPRVKAMESTLAKSEELKSEVKALAKHEAKAENTIAEAKKKEKEIKAYTLLLEKVGKQTQDLKHNLDTLKRLETEWKEKVEKLRAEARRVRISPHEIKRLETLKKDAEKGRKWLREKKSILKKTAEVALAESKRIEDLKQKKEELSARVLELKRTADSMKNIETKMKKFREMKKDAEKIFELRKKSEKTLKLSRSHLTSLTKQIEEKSQTLQKLEKQEADLNKAVKVLDKIDVATELKKLASARKESTAIAKKTQLLNAACKKLTEEKEAKENEIKRQILALESLTNKVNERASSLAELKKQESILKESLKKSRSAAGRSKLKQELLDLQKQISDAREKLQQLRKDTKAVEETELNSRSKLKENVVVLKRISKEILSKESSLDKLAGKEDRLKAEISELNRQIAAKKESVSEKSIREKKEALAKAQKHIELGAAKFERLRSEANHRIKAAEDKEKELFALEKKISSTSKFAKLKSLEAEEEKARKMLDNTKQDIAERTNELTEIKKELGQARVLISNLPAKKKEYDALDRSVKDLAALKGILEKEVHSKEKRVAEGAKLVEDLEESIGAKKAHLDDVEKIMSRSAKNKTELMKMLNFSRDELKKTNDELVKYKQALAEMRKKREELKGIIDTIGKREKAVSVKEKNLLELEKVVSSRQEELTDLEQAKQSAMAVLAEKRKVLEEIKKGLEAHRKDIAELHESTKISHEAEKKAHAAAREAEQKVKELEKAQGKFAKRDTILATKISELREAEDLLKKERTEFEQEMQQHKALMTAAENEWKDKISALEHYRNDISAQSRRVENIVSGDLGELKSKEKEVIDIVSGIEQDKKRLEADERAVAGKVRQLEKEQEKLNKAKEKHDKAYDRLVAQERVMKETAKYIEQQKAKLEREQAKIDKAKDLKKELPTLEKRFRTLTSELKKLETHEEKQMRLSEVGVQKEALRLHHEPAQEAFDDYLRSELGGQSHADIQSMVREAKQCIERGDVDSAIRMAAEIGYLVGKMTDKEEKRLFEYELRDLQTSIKLAQLA